MAEAEGAEYLELANTQYYAWAMVTRDQLLPQPRAARACRAGHQPVPRSYRRSDEGLLRGARLLRRPPQGLHERLGLGCSSPSNRDGFLPCHEARMLPGLTFPSVREHAPTLDLVRLAGFNHFRGDKWMKEPCRTCPEKDQGSRRLPLSGIYAYRRCEPTPIPCAISRRTVPRHGGGREGAAQTKRRMVMDRPIVFRDDKNSRKLSRKADMPSRRGTARTVVLLRRQEARK